MAFRIRARSRPRRKPGQMNKLEAEYAQHLEILKQAGEIQEYYYEAVKLRLADRTFYSPDFLVVTKEGYLEIHETKGFMEDDAAVKVKVVADKYPFRVLLIYKKPKKAGGGWRIQEV